MARVEDGRSSMPHGAPQPPQSFLIRLADNRLRYKWTQYWKFSCRSLYIIRIPYKLKYQSLKTYFTHKVSLVALLTRLCRSLRRASRPHGFT